MCSNVSLDHPLFDYGDKVDPPDDIYDTAYAGFKDGCGEPYEDPTLSSEIVIVTIAEQPLAERVLVRQNSQPPIWSGISYTTDTGSFQKLSILGLKVEDSLVISFGQQHVPASIVITEIPCHIHV